MKKLFSVFAAVSLLAVLVLPAISLAQDELPKSCTMKNDVGVKPSGFCPAKNAVCAEPIAGVSGCGTAMNQWGFCCMMDTVYTVTNWLFYITILLSTLMIVWGGFTYITAAGDPAKTGKGKTIITYALIGLAVALLAKVLPSVLKFIFGI